MVAAGRPGEKLSTSQETDVEKQIDGPLKGDNWIYIHVCMFVAVLVTGVPMLAFVFGEKDCPSDINLVAWEIIEALLVVGMFLNEAFACKPPNAALRCSERIASVGRVALVIWGIVGFFDFWSGLPLPSGMCNEYMWILMPAWSGVSILAVTINYSVIRFCYSFRA